MAFQVKFTDNSSLVLGQMKGNVNAALTALGVEGVGAVKEQMQSGYGKPIRQTGTLMGSISHEKSSENTVDIGTNVKYGIYVHEGTRKMKGRPFIKDGLLENEERLQTVAAEYLKKGF